MTVFRFAFHLLPRFKSSATIAQHVSMVRATHRDLTGFDIADGHAMPRLAACLKTLTNIFPVKRRQLVAITPNFFRDRRNRIPWYDTSIINFTCALELAICGLLRPIEFCPKNNSWTALPYRLARSDVSFHPDLESAKFCLVRVAPAKKHSSALRRLFKQDTVPEAEAPITPLFQDLSKTNRRAPLVYKDFLSNLRTSSESSTTSTPRNSACIASGSAVPPPSSQPDVQQW